MQTECLARNLPTLENLYGKFIEHQPFLGARWVGAQVYRVVIGCIELPTRDTFHQKGETCTLLQVRSVGSLHVLGGDRDAK